MLERDIKNQIKDLFDTMGIFNYPISQGKRSHRGLPDRIFHYQGRPWYLEIKRPGEKLTPSQIKFRDQCSRDGVQYFVVCSVSDIHVLVQDIRRGGYL